MAKSLVAFLAEEKTKNCMVRDQDYRKSVLEPLRFSFAKRPVFNYECVALHYRGAITVHSSAMNSVVT